MSKNLKNKEIEYPEKLDHKGKIWLKTKPFGQYNFDESERAFRDFSSILFFLQIHQIQGERKILELGCGPGWLSVLLSKMGFDVKGLDISPKMIETAKWRAKKENTNAIFEVADIEDQIVKKEIKQNDVCIIYDSLHHCQSDQKVISKAFGYLKPGGILILAEPNRIHGKDAESKRAILKYGVSERGLSYGNLAKICRKLGFQKTWRYHASGQSFLPKNESFYDTMKMIFYPILARFFFGKFQTRIWLVAKK